MDKDKMTIQQARLNIGMSLEKVSEETGQSVKRIIWYEENPGDMTLDESLELCKLYGVNIDEISFKNEISDKREMFFVNRMVSRLTFTSSMKSKISDIMLSVTDDDRYTDRELMKELFELLEEIQQEDNILLDELSGQMNKQNRLNNTLAGR